MNYRSLDRPAEERTKESAHDNYTKNASMITRTGCLAVQALTVGNTKLEGQRTTSYKVFLKI